MAYTDTVRVSKIEIYPTNSTPTLVIELTTDVLQDGQPFASNAERVGYELSSDEAKVALTQALTDAGISFLTVL